MEDKKPWYKSKTLWVAASAAALSFTPLVEIAMAKHPTIVTCSIAALFAALRVITVSGVKK